MEKLTEHLKELPLSYMRYIKDVGLPFLAFVFIWLQYMAQNPNYQQAPIEAQRITILALSGFTYAFFWGWYKLAEEWENSNGATA